jgi:hypothetical protein
MTIHSTVTESLEEIDAAVFSGDTFMTAEGRALFREYLQRWNRWDREACYFANDGTLLSADGSRSIFDDVDQ